MLKVKYIELIRNPYGITVGIAGAIGSTEAGDSVKERILNKWIYATCAHGKWSTSQALILQRILHLIKEYSKGIWNKIKRIIKL